MLNVRWVANLLTFALVFRTFTLIIVAFWILAPHIMLVGPILTLYSPNRSKKHTLSDQKTLNPILGSR
jgi:hypothetical protein